MQFTQIGEIAYSRDNDNHYWGTIRALADSLPPLISREHDVLHVIPSMFAEGARRLGFERSAYVLSGTKWKRQAAKSGDHALYWTGADLDAAVYPGEAEDWIEERRSFAAHVVAAARERSADCLIDLGSGPAVLGLFISLISPLPLINIDASRESIELAEIFKQRYGLPWRNVRIDMATAGGRPVDLSTLQSVIPGRRPFIFTRAAANYYTNSQFSVVLDWFLSIGGVGGLHLEGLAHTTPTFARIREKILAADDDTVAPALDRERNPFEVIENHPAIKVTGRLDIWPQFITREWWSLLAWKARG
ncbi:MAG: hypothetical protein ACXWNU_11055 [Candidatus Binataceae bacterium]